MEQSRSEPDELERRIQLEYEKSIGYKPPPAPVKPRGRVPAVPRSIARGLDVVNALRLHELGRRPGWEAIRRLDDACENELHRWWMARAEYRVFVPSRIRRLTAWAALAIGALRELDFQPHHGGVGSDGLFDVARRGELSALAGDCYCGECCWPPPERKIAALLVALAGRHGHTRSLTAAAEWRRRVRRCNYRHCGAFFIDRSPALNALACSDSHSVELIKQQGPADRRTRVKLAPARSLKLKR